MNSLDSAPVSATNWRRSLAQAVRDPDELCDLLELPGSFREHARTAARLFGLLVPREFVYRMTRGDVCDPLLLQVLPSLEETAEAPGFVADPLVEIGGGSPAGLIQKYGGRALLIAARACAVHCRYCFRRHFPYENAPLSLEDWGPTLNALAADRSLDEVILSGGDPLMRTDEWLEPFVRRIDALPHIARLRLHTRMPIVLPARVDDALVGWISNCRAAVYVVLHANHPREIDEDVLGAFEKLSAAGAVLMCQSVLLRGVNDDVDVLVELFRKLADAKVLPYYLHQLDRVAGAAHFEVGDSLGLELMKAASARLPGYAVPRFVREIPGQPNKTPVGWE